MSKHDDSNKGEIVKVSLGRKKRVKRQTGNVTVRDVIAGVMSVAFGFASIAIIFLIIFTNVSNGFGWAAFILGYASFSCLDTIGTDPKKELDS